MNKNAAALLFDLVEAGALKEPVFILPTPSRGDYVRTGYVVQTDETEKMEIAGCVCGVKSETETSARVYVEVDGKLTGPYTLKPSEVVS